MNQKRDHQSASLSATFYKSMKKTKLLLYDASLCIKANQINNLMLTEIKELFPYLDTTKTHKGLYTTLEMISQQLQTKLINQQIYNFIYNGNYILYNIHLSNRDYISTEHLDKKIQIYLNNYYHNIRCSQISSSAAKKSLSCIIRLI